MKHTLRTLSLLLVLSLLLGSFSSCFALSYWKDSQANTAPNPDDSLVTETDSATESDSATETESTTESGSQEEISSGEGSVDNGPQLPSALEYTLTKEYMDEYYAHLEACKAVTLIGTNVEVIEAAWEYLEEMYYHIATQSQISYVLLCVDESNEFYSDAYLTSSEYQGDAYDAYVEVCRAIYESDSPYRDEFFSDWSEDEIEDMLSHSKEATELSLRNDEILVEFRELDLARQEAQMLTLYREFVENSNKIAQLNGATNYYEYASSSIYDREYTKEQREQFRQYVKTHLPGLIRTVYDELMQKIQSLKQGQYNSLIGFIYDPYDRQSVDYLAKYLESYDEETRALMQLMFDPEHSYFTDSDKAYQGAFTTYLYELETTFCYFGPDYQSVSTIAHEMGHFYASQIDPDASGLLDLAETHSQGNEWLLMAFLEDQMGGAVYQSALYYQLYGALCTILISTIVDEFEEAVYTGEADMEKLNDAMKQICTEYGGLYFLNTYVVGDMQSYWKHVVIQSPVYYLSYGVSGVASLSLYLEAEADYQKAQEIYCRLVAECDPEQSYTEILAQAGLTSPFEAEVYETLVGIFGK